MKTKNQTEQALLELAAAAAANEDRFSSGSSRDAAHESRKSTSETTINKAWSPYEVWRTRVKPGAPRP
jgi:hypothetical protein